MKNIIYTYTALILISCSAVKTEPTVGFAEKYAKTITQQDLKEHLYIYASDEFEGRNTGEPGQKKAVKYLKEFYISKNIVSPFGNKDYFQEIPSAYLSNNKRGLKIKDSENVLAFIKGSEKPDEIVIISAHLDHLGVEGGEIHNGADDDGSGTVAILEIAEAFKKAEKEGNGPKRSILFLHVTGEEKGLLGSSYYTENPIFPLANTVTDLNIDMVGRVDENHKKTIITYI